MYILEFSRFEWESEKKVWKLSHLVTFGSFGKRELKKSFLYHLSKINK